MTLPPALTGLGDRAPFALVFLSSTAIELVAIAALLAVAAGMVVRRATSQGSASDAPRIRFGINLMNLHKLIIPVLSLGLTLWVWTATHGA